VSYLGLISQQRLAERGCKEPGSVRFAYGTVYFQMYVQMTGSVSQVAAAVVVRRLTS
jgi:hypothetical protein